MGDRGDNLVSFRSVVVFFGTRIWCRNNKRTGAILGGGLCCLGEEASVLFGSDLFGRLPPLLGSFFVVTSSC